MISLAWPWVLLLLPLPFLARRLLPPAKSEGLALRLPFFAAVVGLAPRRAALRSRWATGLAAAGWIALVLAAARPQWLGAPVSLPVVGRDLMLAVDISGSMDQDDYRLQGRAATRFDVVKTVAGRFIARREHDRLGLILFGTNAYLQTPLTYDRETVAVMLRESVVGLAGQETAIGDAITLAVKRLRDQPEDNRVLILLTDGEDTSSRVPPLEAAEAAASSKVRIYTIGIGGPTGARSPFGFSSARAPSDIDTRLLREIALRTQGRFFQATDSDELERVYAELDRLEPSTRDDRTFRPTASLYPWPGALALLCSALAALALLIGAPAAHPQEGEDVV